MTVYGEMSIWRVVRGRGSPFNGILDPEFKLGPNEACSNIKKIILQSTYSLPENISTLSNYFKHQQILNAL